MRTARGSGASAASNCTWRLSTAWVRPSRRCLALLGFRVPSADRLRGAAVGTPAAIGTQSRLFRDSAEVVNDLFTEIQHIVTNSLLSVQRIIINDKHCFELYTAPFASEYP